MFWKLRKTAVILVFFLPFIRLIVFVYFVEFRLLLIELKRHASSITVNHNLFSNQTFFRLTSVAVEFTVDLFLNVISLGLFAVFHKSPAYKLATKLEAFRVEFGEFDLHHFVQSLY